MKILSQLKFARIDITKAASNLVLVLCFQQEGQALVAEKPELKPVVEQTLQELQHQWEELEDTTRTKAQCLFDANRAELFTQSCSALDVWLKNLESRLQSDDYGKDLTSVNILLKKHQVDCAINAQLLLSSSAGMLCNSQKFALFFEFVSISSFSF